MQAALDRARLGQKPPEAEIEKVRIFAIEEMIEFRCRGAGWQKSR
jgi:hypothetical protein